MEGRGFSGLFKNSSEELFLKTVMESPIGMPVPTMDMIGFKTVSQSFRADSEELFKRWLTTDQEGYNSTTMGLNSRLSKRISTEIVNMSNQQHVGVASDGRNNDKSCIQNNFLANDVSDDFNFPIRDPVDRELQSSNLFLAKAWFLTDQRMTRSRSSELRRRYTEMQNTQVPQGLDSMFIAPKHDTNTIKEELATFNGFDYLSMCELPSQNQKGSFMSQSNSSSSTFNTHQLVDVDKVSSCVSMLKGTLQRKRLECQVEKAAEEGLNEIFCIREPLFESDFNEGQENWSQQNLVNVQGDFTDQVKDSGVMQTLEGTTNFVLDGFANQMNQMHGGTASGEPSQSESSAAAPVLSSGLDACEGPSNSNQTLCDSSWKQAGESTQNTAKGVREQIIDNLKDDRKKRSLERYGSITSAVSDDKLDPTKKRRVERSRKMAEAKERNLTPTIPSDMQAVLKRCENLEKDVRSLKLNLSFMNRKDSEQTKQIEDLQKQNEDLTDEKERLLEEIERILAESGKI
ncbi:unnamed protein product [Trifolium pratense]|uniref:Uncharacterized protein n=1 Tax=Trifolium pratense TaxID=57577 RepID=A0ACB0JPH8_TRIPR|nr:unnamed protein product [Trifolium pratense]